MARSHAAQVGGMSLLAGAAVLLASAVISYEVAERNQHAALAWCCGAVGGVLATAIAFGPLL